MSTSRMHVSLVLQRCLLEVNAGDGGLQLIGLGPGYIENVFKTKDLCLHSTQYLKDIHMPCLPKMNWIGKSYL